MSARPTFRGAVGWSYVMTSGEKGIYALVTFVLASILGPSDFGTVAMAMVYILFIQMFLEQGLTVALIQRKDLDSKHFDSVFWMVMAFSLALVGVSVGLSGWWAKANHLPALASIIRWLSASILIEALAVVQKAVLLRDMDFKSLSLRSNGAAALGGAVGIGMALGGLGVWALVGQKLGEDIAALALLWKVSHWRPRFQFSLRHLKQLLGFSIAQLFTKVAVFTNRYSTALVLGLFFGPVTVGLYRLAEKLVGIVIDFGTTPLQFAAFPQFSRFQDNPGALRQSVLTCLRLGSILTVPALAGLAAVGSPLMAVMGEKWAPAANALRILCVLGMVEVFMRFAETLLPAVSRPHHLATLKWVQCVVTVGLLVVMSLVLKGSTVGREVVGIALAQFAAGGLLFGPLLIFFLMRLSGLSSKVLVSTIWPSFLAAAAAAGIVGGLAASGLLQSLRPVFVLSAEVVVGGVVGAAVLWAFDSQLKNEIVGLASRVFQHEEAGVPGELSNGSAAGPTV